MLRGTRLLPEVLMAVPLRQTLKVGGYVARQRIARKDKFALVLQLLSLIHI